jgi:hypothetical protein
MLMRAGSSIATNRNTRKARLQTREAKIHRLKLMNDGSYKKLATVYRRFRAAVHGGGPWVRVAKERLSRRSQ